MQERVPRVKFARLEPEKAHQRLVIQKLYEKMTASIKEREDKLCDREDYVEDQEIKFENKEEQLSSLRKHQRENETEPEKRQVERTKICIVFGQDVIDGQRATIGRACQELWEQVLIAETASKLVIRPESLT